jgi:protoporphyrinogen oxidase
MEIYDYIIIGGGISGIYSLYKLNRFHKNKKILLIEKENYLGGRVLNKTFHNEKIRLGAGIAKDDNYHLMKLLKKLKIKYLKVDGEKTIIDPNFDKIHHFNIVKKIKNTLKKLKEENIEYSHLTVKEFLNKYLTKEESTSYISHLLYAEYLDGDINYYVENDPMYDDNVIGKYSMNIVDWDILLEKLLNGCKKSQIKKNTQCKIIRKVKSDDIEYFLIETDKKNYICKNVICALTINIFNKITKSLKLPDYTKIIGSIPFSRIYTFHKNGHNFISEKTKTFNVMFNKNILHKIILMGDKILMASYTNGEKSKRLKRIDDKGKGELLKRVDKELKKIIPTTNDVSDIIFKYWEEGVHYYKPLNSIKLNILIKKLRNPIKNFYVVGEMLSHGQGWVEGAIESVDNISDLVKCR